MNPILLYGLPTLLILLFIILYNSLIGKNNEAKESWSGIEVQMKRRYDLIPNLVETVKGYSKHESEVFEKVTKARTAAMSATSMKDHGKNEAALNSGIKSIFALAENYPDLKANQNFLQLQEELSDTEDKLQAARRFYNSTVKGLNTALESIPTNFIGKIAGLQKREFFELEASEKDTASKPVETKF